MPYWTAGAMLGAAAISGAGAAWQNSSASGFSKKAYKHRYQWQVQDMKKAGLNPMLAFSQGAGNVAQPNFQNVGEAAADSAMNAGSAVAQRKMVNEQLENIRQDTNLKMAQQALADSNAHAAEISAESTRLDNLIKAESVPFAAANAYASYRNLDAIGRQANNAADKLSEEVLIRKQERVQNTEMMPLLKLYQQYMNQAAKLSIPAAEAEAKFYDEIGAGEKYGKFGLMLLEALKQVTR